MPRIFRPNTNITRLSAFDAINLRLTAIPPPAPADIPFRAANLAEFNTFYRVSVKSWGVKDKSLHLWFKYNPHSTYIFQ